MYEFNNKCYVNCLLVLNPGLETLQYPLLPDAGKALTSGRASEDIVDDDKDIIVDAWNIVDDGEDIVDDDEDIIVDA